MQNKIIKTAVLLLVAIACIAGCRKCSEIEDRPLTYLDSLPVLTETAQILDAVSSRHKKLYLIENYRFEKTKTFSNPSTLSLVEGKFVYYGVTEQINDHMHHTFTKYGRLFFDENIELLNFKNSRVRGFPSQKQFRAVSTRTHKKDEVDWYVSPDAKFTFVAKLGANKAELTGYDNERVIVSGGDRETLAEASATHLWWFNMKYLLILVVVVIVCVIGVIWTSD